MAKLSRLVLATLGSAALLAGCATYPYDYGYGYGYDPYYGAPYYADPYFYGPGIGFGFAYSDRGGYWRDHDGRWHDRSGNWRDRDGSWRDRDGNAVVQRDTRQWIDRSNEQVGGPNVDRRRGESGG